MKSDQVRHVKHDASMCAEGGPADQVRRRFADRLRLMAWNPEELRRWRTDPGAQRRLNEWAVEAMNALINEHIEREAKAMADKHGMKLVVARVALASELHNATKVLREWQSAVMRADGYPLTAISEAIGWTPTASIKRLMPHLEDIEAAQRQADEQEEVVPIDVDRYRILLEPERRKGNSSDGATEPRPQ